MQKLYEQHKVLTYPRTSSRFLTQDIEPTLAGLVSNLSVLDEYKSIIERNTKGGLKGVNGKSEASLLTHKVM